VRRCCHHQRSGMPPSKKEAFQRKHNLLPRPPSDMSEAAAEPPPKPRQPRSASEAADKITPRTAYHRRHNLLPRKADASAVPAAAPAAAPAALRATSSTAPLEQTWAQRRKENIIARSAGPRHRVDVDVAGATVSLKSQLVFDSCGQAPSSSGANEERAPPSESPLRAGDVCEVVGGDKHTGCRGVLVALVDKAEDLGDSYAFFKLSSGQRAVLSLSALQRCHGQLDGASDFGSSEVQLSAADILISKQGLPDSGRMLHEQQPDLEPTTSGPGDLMTAVQRKRARKRGRGERRSKDAPVHHSVEPLSC
jgi:hypothetical protein